jgi:hypothetical protein
MNQSTVKDLLTHQLGQKILDAYGHGLFGRVSRISRTEIDAIVFATAVKIILLIGKIFGLSLKTAAPSIACVLALRNLSRLILVSSCPRLGPMR